MKSGTRNTTNFVIGSIVLVIIAGLIYLSTIPGGEGHSRGMVPGTTYSNAYNGAELTYNFLENMGYEPFRSRYPLDGSEYGMRDFDVLWHFQALMEADEDEIDWIRDWVDKGGTLIIVGNSDEYMFSSLPLSAGLKLDNIQDDWFTEMDVESTTPELLGNSEDYDGDVQPHRLRVYIPDREWKFEGLDKVNTYIEEGPVDTKLFRMKQGSKLTPYLWDAHGVIIGFAEYGRGKVWVVSDPMIFSNMLLQEEDNAALLVSMLMDERGRKKGRILFDEYHHGFFQTRGISDAVRTPFGKGLMYLAFVVALGIGSAGARFGRVRKVHGAIGVSQRAFVSSLAGLWQAAGATQTAADALYRRYRNRLNVRKSGYDLKLDEMRSEKGNVENLLDIARELDNS
ncbi:MAG TPA: DUF4350 domain-containing protein [bacterium]|jgi:hypothetical protein